MNTICRRLGLPRGVGLHTLRHSHGSHLLSAGVPLTVVSKRLGHSSVLVTARIYAHQLEQDSRRGADAWEGIAKAIEAAHKKMG
jgi:integrase